MSFFAVVPPPQQIYACYDPATGQTHNFSSPCSGGLIPAGHRPNNITTAPPQSQAGNGLYQGAANPFPSLAKFISDNAAFLKATGLVAVGLFLLLIGAILMLGAEIGGVKNAAV